MIILGYFVAIEISDFIFSHYLYIYFELFYG
jgi:hypothetical protein